MSSRTRKRRQRIHRQLARGCRLARTAPIGATFAGGTLTAAATPIAQTRMVLSGTGTLTANVFVRVLAGTAP